MWRREQAGNGAPARPGDLVTVHLVAVDETGREVANTRRRGLSLTLLTPEPQWLDLWGALLPGVRPGDRFRAQGIRLEAMGLNENQTLFRSGARLTLEVHVLNVRRRTDANSS